MQGTLMVEGKIVTYPYIHYHYSHFVADNPGWNVSTANTIFQQAFKKNSSINLVAHYDNKNYGSNLEALTQLNGMLQELADPQAIESAIVQAIQERRKNSTLQQRTSDIANFKNNYKQLAGQTMATSKKILNFVEQLASVLNLPNKDKDILTQIALFQLEQKKNLVSLQNLVQDLRNATGILKTGSPNKLNKFLNEFQQLLQNNQISSSNKVSQFSTFLKDEINKGIGEELDLTVVSTMISKLFSQFKTECEQTGDLTRTRITYEGGDLVNSNIGAVKAKPDSIIHVTSQNNSGLQAKLEFDFGVSSKYYNDYMLMKYGAQVHAGNFYHAALAALEKGDTEVTQHLLGNTIGLIKDMDPNSGPYMTLSAAIIRKFAVEYFTGTGWGVKGGIGADLKDNAHILMINGEPYSMREIMSRIQNTTNVEDLFKFARIQTYNKGLNVWDSSTDNPVTNALIRSSNTLNKIHGLQMQIHYHPEQFLQTMGRKS